MSGRAGDRLRKVWALDDSVGPIGRALCAVAAVLVAFLLSTVADPTGVRVLIGLVAVLIVYPALLAAVRLTRRRSG